MSSVALISHPDCLRHWMGEYHPEAPQRITEVQDHLLRQGLDVYLVHHEAPLVPRIALERVHDPIYLDALEASVPTKGLVHLDPDTAMNPDTLIAAKRAAGAAVRAVDLVLNGEVSSAFCLVRPPGHHAERSRAMGFCFFNNVAVAAAHALAHGLARVTIVDWDVHHGNGTEEIFRADPRVQMVSIFQHPFYPYRGTKNQPPHMVNVPLPAYSGSNEFRQVVTEKWLPAIRAHRPEMILISAGFDSHIEDDMGALALRESDYGWATLQLIAALREITGGSAPIVSVLEGGYALSSLARSVAAHLKAMIEG
ncbi:MAG: histone deacetylase family protein [Hydrogenophilus sp.]|nr:histone deacetylase family protein [Hydrogenophilus sp.]